MRVKAIWEFEADVEEFDPNQVDIKGLAEDLTRRELEFLLQNRDLQADDFNYEVESQIMKYKVDVTETYKRTIEIEAEDSDEAYDKVDQMINEGEIDLPCDGGGYDYERFLIINKED